MVKNVIKVYARLKPEKNRNSLMNYRVLHRPRDNLEEDLLVLASPIRRSKDVPENRPESWNFSFFRIFEEFARQEDVFESVARPVVDSALDGYNGTIFAYGQTASGKTHAMTGKLEKERGGIVPRSLRYLFAAIGKRPENVYSVEVAYLEIYNETGYDLLDPRQQSESSVTRSEDLPRIGIFEDEFGKLRFKNLTFHRVRNAEDALELLAQGDGNRIVAETPSNPQSSRSHCIFTMVVCAKPLDSEEYKRAKVQLVDLAGSERVYKCSISGTVLTEAKHINLSLHYLEQVIVCLGEESAAHIPYRNSLLTSILRDSLGGNCATAMLATLSVASFNFEETLSTCRFAQRVALVKNELKLNLEKDVGSENALLRAENERLRRQISALTGHAVSYLDPKPISIRPIDRSRDIFICFLCQQQAREELTAEDKRDLDDRIASFLHSDEQVLWDYQPRKVRYCFESFKKAFGSNEDRECYSKKLHYYERLVLQRDKQISLLIDAMQREKERREEKKGQRDAPRHSPADRVPPKTQKQGSKISSPDTRNENISNTVEARNVGKDSIEGIRLEQTSRGALVSPVTSEPDPLPRNLVNSISSDPAKDKSRRIARRANVKPARNGETGQRSSSAAQRKPRIAGKKLTDETPSKDELEDEEIPGNASSATETSETKEVSRVETNCSRSAAVYEKFLRFDKAPPRPKDGSKDASKDSRRIEKGKSNGYENSRWYEVGDSLPLTGDPEIDEEIVAFYKAKRSGGAY